MIEKVIASLKEKIPDVVVGETKRGVFFLKDNTLIVEELCGASHYFKASEGVVSTLVKEENIEKTVLKLVNRFSRSKPLRVPIVIEADKSKSFYPARALLRAFHSVADVISYYSKAPLAQKCIVRILDGKIDVFPTYKELESETEFFSTLASFVGYRCYSEETDTANALTDQRFTSLLRSNLESFLGLGEALLTPVTSDSPAEKEKRDNIRSRAQAIKAFLGASKFNASSLQLSSLTSRLHDLLYSVRKRALTISIKGPQDSRIAVNLYFGYSHQPKLEIEVHPSSLLEPCMELFREIPEIATVLSTFSPNVEKLFESWREARFYLDFQPSLLEKIDQLKVITFL